MEKVVAFNEKPPAKTQHNTCIEPNLTYARKWYKEKKWLDGMKIKVSDCGSAQNGMIKNGILTISYQPLFGSKVPNLAQPISTLSPLSIFKNQLDELYNSIYEHAVKYNQG